MKKHLLHIGLIAAAAACGLQLMAIPAKPGIRPVQMADGTTINVRLVGDEYHHQYFTEDGFPLMEKNGDFYYCDFDAKGNLIDSGIKAANATSRDANAKAFLSKINMTELDARIRMRASESPRRLSLSQQPMNYKAPAKADDDNDGPPYDRGYGLFPDLRFPAYGDQKAIVILVEYTDVKFHDDYKNNVSAKDYFTRMLNEEGFKDYGGTGSAAQYFRENSGGHFRPEFDVYGPITLSKNQAYYGGNDVYGNDQHPADMIKEACEQLDDIIDFRDYDRNKDGVVDNIFVFYAGRGEASGGSSKTVWPHSWNMEAAGYRNLYFDGVRIHTYGCTNEWESNRPDGVGTFVHEFSHVMGLPDLYATSYTSSFTPGGWSALDYGPYNNDGMTPPNYGAFERYALGWLKPRAIDRAISATLPPVSENVCGIIRSDSAREFFLVENRQQEGWDAFIPGHGMLIWHVDYNTSVWQSNVVNNTPAHQYVDIEEADGTQSEYSRSGDSFPGTSFKTSFTSSTSPAMKTWSGVGLEFPITDINEYGGTITFNVLGGAYDSVDPLELNEPTNVGADTFTLSWQAPDEGNDVILSIYKLADNSENSSAKAAPQENRIYLTGYKSRNLGNASSVTVEGAEPTTTYYYEIQHVNGWTVSEISEGSVVTGRYTIEYYAVEANDVATEDITETSFKGTWQPLEEATGYLVSLFKMFPSGPYETVNHFDHGTTMDEGWATTTTNSYELATYAGENVPSLRMTKGNTVTTPVFDDYIKGISFWSRGNNTTEGDMINVYAISASGYEKVDSVLVSKTAGGQLSEIKSLPEKTKQIIIEFDRRGDKGALAFDDLTVFHGLEYDAEPVEACQNEDAGNALEYNFTNLLPGTYYYFTVRATDGSLFSQDSNRVMLQTLSPEGVQHINDGVFSLNVSGLSVTSSTDDEIVVADYTGVIVARGVHKVMLPRGGLYIITVPARDYVKKLIAR